MEKVTVIVPIFNAGPYLRQCLDSIVNQTYTNLDILLINDGSTDGSAKICEEFAQADSRVRVVHRPLGGSGVGAVRNAALNYVKGDYVLFVDNDDWLDEKHIESLYQALIETNSDISIANFVEFLDEEKSFKFYFGAKDYYQKVFTPKEWFKMQYFSKQGLSQCFTVPWSKLYKAELFDDIVYPENEKVEDDYTTWKIYLNAERIVYQHTGIYIHRKHSSSVTKTVDIPSVFPIRSIEERIAVLGNLGFNISEELEAYQIRLRQHLDYYLEVGNMQEFNKCLHKLRLFSEK